jgi:hypothetical protein
MVKKKHDWYMKRRKEVLYFDVYLDEKGEYTKCKFRRDSDSLVLFTMNYRIDAPSHYTVFSYKNENGSVKYQKVYNHIGNDVTEKLRVQDAAKRILLFVNGYRPTSVGHSFEDNFNDIKSNGLEYPNSTNLIYSFDRFNYWRPWQEIDLKFQKKINAAEIYYADGHFSVGTSNHESLLNFTSLSTMYPKRCKNLKKHHCYQTTKNSTGIFGEKKVDTYSLLPTKPNKRGFRERYDHGKVAAKNLLMTLNEFPNRSYDDTLYIVAHSMGYAYSLGMIDELRGKIHFGGFYIIAPENASLGKVNISEWQEVWQYGSEFNKKAKDAPCLQDGVAPQACVGGLNENYRVYIPHRFDYRKGFFNSHFVGYYTWIFNIPEGRKGAIKQR